MMDGDARLILGYNPQDQPTCTSRPDYGDQTTKQQEPQAPGWLNLLNGSYVRTTEDLQERANIGA